MARGPSRLTRRVALIAAVVLAVVACGSDRGGAPAAPSVAGRPVTVALYGDSLAWEAKGDLQALLGERVTLLDRTLPGLALCAALPAMAADAAADPPPELAVVQYSGNPFGACMAEAAAGGAATIVARYQDDARRAVTTLAPVPVLFVGSPRSRAQQGGLAARVTDGVNEVFALVATETGSAFVDAGRAVYDEREAYADVLPCLPGEPCEDVELASGERGNPVRAPDGVHFCPTGLGRIGEEPCAVHSSGAARFAAAIAAAITTVLDARDQAPSQSPSASSPPSMS